MSSYLSVAEETFVRLLEGKELYYLLPAFYPVSAIGEEVFASFASIKEKAYPIFQRLKGPPTKHRGDGKRLQSTNYTADWMMPIQSKVESIMHRALNVRIVEPFCSLLVSLPSCEKQDFHCDYNPDYQTPEDGWGVIYALYDNTKLYGTEREREIEIAANAGDLIVFRGDFAHAGADYSTFNVRLHWYLETAGRKKGLRKLDTTYRPSEKDLHFEPLPEMKYFRARKKNFVKINAMKKLRKIKNKIVNEKLNKDRKRKREA